MSEPATSSISPRIWIAAVGLACTAAVGIVSFVIGLLTIGGVLLTTGGWKSSVDYRIQAVETTSKEQIAALTANTDKQIVALTASCKEMVTTSDANLGKRIEDIERDRKDHISQADAWRANESATVTELKTLVTGQQKQIDLLTEQSTHRSGRP